MTGTWRNNRNPIEMPLLNSAGRPHQLRRPAPSGSRSLMTVAVAAASGAVGSVVGQIAKIKGCRAVGIAGGPDKCRFVVEELGFDACVDHRAGDFVRQLLRPAHSRCHQLVTRIPKASAISSPP
jgi:NADPH:quinone reductase-like Zn-dependent oxidoreductase